MDGGYLIPANSKKSMLIFGLFTKIDLIIFGLGITVSLIMLLILPITNLTYALIALIPGLVSAFLVFPVPNYHNMRCAIQTIFLFYTTRQRYIWKGWNYKDGEGK